jgi:hypothetical protein
MSLFAKKEKISIALIDISSSSVGAGLAHLVTGEQPVLYYTNRLPIERSDNEDVEDTMLRTLNAIADALIKKGAPALRHETGSGHVDRIIASVSTPWQTTSIRSENITAAKPFTFTKALLTETTQKGAKIPSGYISSGESVVATLLNGYEMTRPFGKRATRAELIILSSLIEKAAAHRIEEMLRKTYHTHSLTLTAFAPIAYTVFRDIFPHEKDFLVLDVSGESTDIAFVKQNLLVNVASMPHGINELVRKAHAAAQTETLSNERFGVQVDEAQKEWIATLSKTLQEFSTHYALPRTLFLLANPESRDFLKNLLDTPSLRSLWLTDEPLAIIPIVPSHFGSFVKTRGTAEGDVYLALLALFANPVYPPPAS